MIMRALRPCLYSADVYHATLPHELLPAEMQTNLVRPKNIMNIFQIASFVSIARNLVLLKRT
jgi:hypothetical protein